MTNTSASHRIDCSVKDVYGQTPSLITCSRAGESLYKVGEQRVKVCTLAIQTVVSPETRTPNILLETRERRVICAILYVHSASN